MWVSHILYFTVIKKFIFYFHALDQIHPSFFKEFNNYLIRDCDNYRIYWDISAVMGQASKSQFGTLSCKYFTYYY